MLPVESVTLAVMVCVPLLKLLAKLPPVPICPSRVELNLNFAVRLPSCRSDALPEKLTVAPYGKEEPVAGLLIVTAGGLLADTVTVVEAEAMLPAASVTLAV